MQNVLRARVPSEQALDLLKDADTAELIIEEFGHKAVRVSDADVEDVIQTEQDSEEDLQPRPPVITVISYDADQLDGNAYGVGSIWSGANSATLTKLVGDGEGITGKKFFVGENGVDNNQLCTEKTVNNLGQVQGLCPEAPRLDGSYRIANCGAVQEIIIPIMKTRTSNEWVTILEQRNIPVAKVYYLVSVAYDRGEIDSSQLEARLAAYQEVAAL